jgi:hypothetical protein
VVAEFLKGNILTKSDRITFLWDSAIYDSHFISESSFGSQAQLLSFDILSQPIPLHRFFEQLSESLQCPPKTSSFVSEEQPETNFAKEDQKHVMNLESFIVRASQETKCLTKAITAVSIVNVDKQKKVIRIHQMG